MSCIHGSICFLRVLTPTTSLNTQLNFIFCMFTRLLRELCFVPLTGVQHHSSGFIWCQNAHWEPDDEASDRSNAPEKLQSDNRWVVTLSGTSHWYSNLLHFPRERTPQWKHYCPPPSRLWSHWHQADRSRHMMEAAMSSGGSDVWNFSGFEVLMLDHVLLTPADKQAKIRSA